MRATQRDTGALLAALFLMALALRLWAIPDFGNHNVFDSESGAVAQQLLAGNGFAFEFYGLRLDDPLRSFVPPLYPLLIWLTHAITPDYGVAWLFVLQAVLGSASVVLIYHIGRKLTERALIGWLAAIALTFYPVYIITAGIPHAQSVVMFLVLLVVLLALCAVDVQATGWHAVALGVAYGVMLLIRPMWIGFAPLLLLWLWWVRAGRAWRWVGTTFAVTIGIAFLVVLPWLIRNAEIHNQVVWISTNGGFTFWSGNNPFTTGSGLGVDADKLAAYTGVPRPPGQPDIVPVLMPYQMPLELDEWAPTWAETDLDGSLYGAGWTYIRENPVEWQALWGQKLLSFGWFRPNVDASYGVLPGPELYRFLYALLLLLSVIGFVMARRTWRPFALPALIIAYYVAFYTMFQVQPNCRWEIEPLLILFGALPFAWMSEQFGEWLAIRRDALPMAAS